MKKVYKKKIDWIFYNEKRIEKAVHTARIDTPKDIPVISDKNKISDPTAQIALHNLTPLSSVIIGGDILKYPEHWLTVISKTYDWCKRQSEVHFQAVKKNIAVYTICVFAANFLFLSVLYIILWIKQECMPLCKPFSSV